MDTRPPPRKRSRLLRFVTIAFMAMVIAATSAFTPLSSSVTAPAVTEPVVADQASPAQPRVMPVVDETMQNPPDPDVVPSEPIQPRVRYNAYNVPGMANWNNSVTDLTVEGGQAGIEANLNDPLFVANMEALRNLGTRPTLRPDKDAVYERAEHLWDNPDELEAAAEMLMSQIVEWEVASSDRPFWMQTVRLGAGDATRPDIENVRFDIPQGTFLSVTFDNGRVQKFRFESGMAPIIGIKPRPEPVPAASTTGGSASPSSNVEYDPVWDRLAQCESGGRWDINTGNDYYGGLQFALPTWRDFGGNEFDSMPNEASKLEQIIVATRTWHQQGWGAWPSCTRRLGITEPPGPAPSLEQPAPAPAAPAVQPVAHTSSIADEIVRIAHEQIGEPYVWGATGPNSFDCSGFIYYVFNEAGVDIPRERAHQYVDNGSGVSFADMRPGDIVISNLNRDPSHIGIYIGNGKKIHAPGRDRVVEISDVGSPDRIRRLV